MSQEREESDSSERSTLPIERGFPIERVNEIAAKESRAKQWYRPIYTMHKWWARRLGCVFRTICLYTLVDDTTDVSIRNTGQNESLDEFGATSDDVASLIADVDLTDPDSMWGLYSKDVRVTDTKILDPFMGGGTSLVEASRLGADVYGSDLNPVAWFVTKKQFEADGTSTAELQRAFERVRDDVAAEIDQYYRTSCPNGEHEADVVYGFWVKQLGCVSCGETVSLFKDYRVAKGRYENDDQYNVFCPECASIFHVSDWRSETQCPSCTHQFTPSEGPASGANYTCRSCGQKYVIRDAIQEQGGFDRHYYALEYYCRHCDEAGRDRSEYKGYQSVTETDRDLYNQAAERWASSPELHEYVPSDEVPAGAVTSTEFGGRYDGYDLREQGYPTWDELFNPRQRLGLALLLRSIDQIEDQNLKEYLLLALSDSLMFQNEFCIYNLQANKIEGVFKSNTFAPQRDYVENNVWGTEFGRGTFQKSWEKLLRGVEYANAPTERYIEDGETLETEPFAGLVNGTYEVTTGDATSIDVDETYDAIITDPPYYDNIIYSELSDFFYVWQRQLLSDTYPQFEPSTTPRSESVVVNPAEGKDDETFENELGQAFSRFSKLLNDDGVLAFTYHHSGAESWGEVLQSLCDAGFTITATYPVNADIARLDEDDQSVSFDIVIVARPATDREPISWNSLRRNIYRTAQTTRQRLEENRDLSRGDIGVVEMGRCFHEYSKHHGEVRRAGEIMTAKEVVDRIYGIISPGNDIGEVDVFLDLFETGDPSYDDLNKLTRGTDATPERMQDMRLYRMDNGFTLGTWDDEARIAYIQDRVANDEELTDLDRAQLLRYRWEHGKSITEYLEQWEITDDLRELCEGLADATGDETYRNVLESRLGDWS